jgi:hypothetical protein
MKEAAQKLVSTQRHRTWLAPITSRILETDCHVVDLDDSVIVQRTAIERSSEVLQHLDDTMLGLIYIDLPPQSEFRIRELEMLGSVHHHLQQPRSEGFGQ